MTLFRCDQEQKVFAAVRFGSLDPSLQNHVSHCSICADLVFVAEFMRENSPVPETEVRLPNADFIWWKAQLRTRQAALQRATRPIDLVAKIGSVAAGLAGLWFISCSSQTLTWIESAVHSQWLSHPPYWGEFTLLGGLGTIVCILIGSLFTLRP